MIRADATHSLVVIPAKQMEQCPVGGMEVQREVRGDKKSPGF